MGWFSSTSTEEAKQNQSQQGSATNKVIYDPEVLFQRNFILDFLRQQISGNEDFGKQYETSGLNSIDQAGLAKQRIAENMARSRGIGNTSAGINIGTGVSNDTLNEKAGFLRELPMFMENIRRQRIGDLSNFVNAQPYGGQTDSSSTSSMTSSAKATRPGGIFQDLLGAAAGLAGGFFGGAFGSKKPNSSSLGNI